MTRSNPDDWIPLPEMFAPQQTPVAALFVMHNGPYFKAAGIDPWDERRNAMLYAGRYPVVAHPPCDRWGRYAKRIESEGGPRVGDDGGAFAFALDSVRRWGGVLEHPEGSLAWPAFGLLAPPRYGGWVPAGDFVGWTCYVEQGHFGHRARKATWLYSVRCILPNLPWGKSEAKILPREGRDPAKERRRGAIERMCTQERERTPADFRDMLIWMARSCYR